MLLEITILLLSIGTLLLFAKPLFKYVGKRKTSILELQRSLDSIKKRTFDDSKYFRQSELILITSELQKINEALAKSKTLFLPILVQRLNGEIHEVEKMLSIQKDQTNTQFIRKEKERAQALFSAADGKELLTEEQVTAVLTDDNRNLIIAGAGSGKTRVIDFKVRYLVNYKNIDPSKIILLSFSRKSARDLTEKISENIPGIEARTIHSFSATSIGRQGRKLFDDSKKELEFFVIKALMQTLQEKDSYKMFNEFYEKYFSELKSLIYYKSLDELRLALKKCNSKLVRDERFGEIVARRALKTLKGDFVRSVDERYIADFLYLQNINYEYERRYPHSTETYYPDFYLVDYDIYLEHFALISESEVPAYFDQPQKYLQGMIWKRELHKQNKTKLIETHSYLLNAGNTSEYLKRILEKGGIAISTTLDEEKAYGKISNEFSKFFIRFYNALKLSGFSLTELKSKFSEPKYFLFLRLFEGFFSNFKKLSAAENKMDFSDLLLEASEVYRSGGAKSFDYIIVDEFQDTSNLAMKLLDEVHRVNPNAALFCVGDDWQSIYGFNGSDVSILGDYTNRYAGVSSHKLNSNFRSHDRIVNLGKRFVSKNPAQIPKAVISKNLNYKNSEVAFLSFEQMEEKIGDIPNQESVFVLYRYNEDCPVDQGNFGSLFYRDKSRKPVKKSSCSKNISLMTIHASKGLEARHVFVLFPDGIRRKFPSEIEDHYIFNMLKTTADEYPFSEERRLMYVAITRAEQNLYFVCPRGKSDPNSVFWDELKAMV